MTTNKTKEELWDKQGAGLRDPAQVLGGDYAASGVVPQVLEYELQGDFAAVLHKLGITLFVTREYEHLALSLSADKKGSIDQRFLHLPHPSGLAVDRNKGSVYIAATRNPNQIIEFKPGSGFKHRIDGKGQPLAENYLMPIRTKFYPGCYYFHDLAVMGGTLYANSVGQNGVIKVDMADTTHEELIWWPKCVEENGKPNTTANYIQLNSISGGANHEEAFYTASSASIASTRPGDLDYPVDKQGVVFSGKTREVYGTGLTRPHSSRLYEGKIWIDNSGYGELGTIVDGKFKPALKLPGWTRGLCIVNGVFFVGVSRVLPKFSVYAPGLKTTDQICGVYAIDYKTMKILGAMIWPYGNQIFAIDWIEHGRTPGFIFDRIEKSTDGIVQNFYRYVLN